MTTPAAADRIANIWGERQPYVDEWSARVDAHVIATPERWVQSACVLCSNGCALDIAVRGGRIVGVRGRAGDRVNKGRLGPKGLHGWIANNSPDRLTRPLIRTHGKLKPASWEEAMALVVDKSRDAIKNHGRGSIGMYTSGQLFLEEYYTQAIIARAGIRTNHLDGNTRLCTATAAMALIESFGTDGDPGSYRDYDVTDAVFLVGHNMAETQTVLWSRLLDRRAGPRPPVLVVVDPRTTPTAHEADLHLTPRLGTNLALLNGLLFLFIQRGYVDARFIRHHTVGYERLREIVAAYPPRVVTTITGVPSADIERAAELLGTAPSLITSTLQGVYQSMQATAAAIQLNNLHLLRGLIGKPGSTVFQMNGQPTAQNTRECGANGELAAGLNWNNPRHVERLARHWNVEPKKLPHYAPPTHVMQMFEYAEQGSLRMLWITATNPAVSMPESARIRKILSLDSLFVVVNDAFPTETTERADVVFPAALWGEKTGTFTNADRTVHISHRAVEPPGEARSDLDILLDYARRMDFRDKDEAPLIKWTDARGAFEHFRELTRGRPCDYSGLGYELLSAGSGIQWPCNEEHPHGRERLYTDHRFATAAEECETFGHDLESGAPVTPEQYRANDPDGRAMLKGAHYMPPLEAPDDGYPYWLTTGRRVYQFHTRTKTARAPALNAAAPRPELEISVEDAAREGITSGQLIEVESRRGRVEVVAKIAVILQGHVFLPFHYGYWDRPGHPTAANELTLSSWDPVSKQPHFKYAAVRLKKI
jgi:anaerobic selenocysteine-containing dehydrogenase